MGIGHAFLLGILQGLTEFLPVSSSGHLVLGKYLFGLSEQGVAFEVFVHFGTLLAVLTAFSRQVWHLVLAFFRMFQQPPATLYKEDADFRMMFFIIIASVPAAIVGLAFKDQISGLFSNPRFACAMLIVTSVVLALTFFSGKIQTNLKPGNSILMGIAQAFAILPGISRAGSTISVGLFLKVDGSTAARFSFLMAIPAILGATVLEISHIFQGNLTDQQFITLTVGMISAYISGYLAIETMLNIVRRGKLYWFAPYCLLVGVLGLIFI